VVLLAGLLLLAWAMRVELYSLASATVRALRKYLAGMKMARQAKQGQRVAAQASAAGSKPSGKAAREPSPTHWPGSGDFGFEVVGESHYQRALAAAAGNEPTRYEGFDCVAQLVPEDDNSYDKSAVAVCVNGSKVGHLSRDDARSFRRRLGSKGLTGVVTTCDAVIRGGARKADGSTFLYGIWLDITPFN
jgi:hypothetical protein